MTHLILENIVFIAAMLKILVVFQGNSKIMLTLKSVKILMVMLIALLISNLSIAEPLKVWGNGELPPMAYVENGAPKGFGVEITKAVLDEAGIEHKLILAPWKQAYVQAKAGNGLVFGMYWTEERSKHFDYSIPLWEEEIVLVTKKGNDFSFDKIDDLKGRVVALQRGARPGTEFEKALENKLFEAIEHDSPVKRLKILNLNRVDAVVSNPGLASVVWNARLAGIPISEFTVLKKPLSVEAKYIGIAKTLYRKDLIEKINAAIERLNKKGVIQTIIKHYETVK